MVCFKDRFFFSFNILNAFIILSRYQWGLNIIVMLSFQNNYLDFYPLPQPFNQATPLIVRLSDVNDQLYWFSLSFFHLFSPIFSPFSAGAQSVKGGIVKWGIFNNNLRNVFRTLMHASETPKRKIKMNRI